MRIRPRPTGISSTVGQGRPRPDDVERAAASRTRDDAAEARNRSGERDLIADRRDEQSAIYDQLARDRDATPTPRCQPRRLPDSSA